MLTTSLQVIDVHCGHMSKSYPPSSMMQDAPSASVSITKLHVPLSMMITILLVIAAGISSLSAVWWRTDAHANDRTMHVDKDAALKGGGVAYQGDLSRVAADFDKRFREQHAKTRKLLRSMGLNCRKTAEGLACVTILNEDE